MKVAIKIILILFLAVALIVSYIFIGDKSEDVKCTGMQLTIRDSLSLGFVTTDSINKILDSKKISIEGRKITEINQGHIVRAICENPYVDTATCTLTSEGIMKIDVTPKIPALYVIPDTGKEYVMDRRGSDMPMGEKVENLCVATGKIDKEFARQKLVLLANFIQDNEFWHDQIQQIVVENEHDIHLYTRFTNHTIQFGEIENIADKFWRLKAFYEEGLPKIGWDKYEEITLEYDGIVIGKKREEIIKRK